MKEEVAAASIGSDSKETPKQKQSGNNSFFRIFTYADSVGWILNIVAFASAIAAGTILPLMDLVFGKTITSFNSFGQGSSSAGEFTSQLTSWTLWFIYLFIAKFVLTYIWSFCLNMSAIRTTKALRVDLLRQTLRQDLAFYDKNDSGAISIHVTTNGNLINTGISEKMGIIIQGLSTFFAAFIVAFAVNWKLTLITFAVVPTILITIGICLQIELGLDEHILKSYSRAGNLADEVFASIRTVHAFWAQPNLSMKYATFLQDAKNVGLKKNLLYGFYYSIEYFCIYAGYGLAFWQGSRRYASGEIRQPGDVVTVIFAIILAATALTQVAPQFVHISKATSAAAELFEIIDREPLIDSLSEGGIKPQDCKGLVEIRDVKFAYPTRADVPVLKGISLTLPPGKTTAVVGASGSGKSTIVGLIERWYDPSSGLITIDNHKIEDINIEWLRTNIRVVQQEPILFNTTIFQNVAYGLIGTQWEASGNEEQMRLVVEACKSANAHDFIEQQPEGYHTLVGERASRLSGGQKQRIAIARSIISKPTILLLDEATSALDPKAERIVQDVLDQVSESRTTLIIAHKLSTVRKADNIVVMHAGEIVEEGSHDTLMSVNGAYARLVRAQDLGADSEQSNKAQIDKQLTRSKTAQTDASQNAELTGIRDVKNKSLLSLLWRVIKEKPNLRPYYWIIFMGCVLGGGGFPVSAVLFAKAMTVFTLSGDELVAQGDFWALMFFVLSLGIFMIYFTLGFASNKASQDLTYDYRLEMFDDTTRQDMEFFDKPENTTGAIVSRLSSYPSQLQDLVGFNASLILISLVQILASSILAIAYAWKVGLVVIFGGLTVMSFAGWLRIRLETMLDESTTQKFADSAALASEATSAIRTVSSLALEKTTIKEYQNRLSHVETKSLKSLTWTMFWFALTQSVNLLAMALGFWYGSTLVASGEFTLEQFYIAFIAVLFSGEGAAALFQYTTSITKASSAATYMFWLKDFEPSIKELGPGFAPQSSGKAGLAYDDVHFAYPARLDVSVLRGIDVNVYPGQSVAFVGPSGCGKSTMLALAERFYNLKSGIITFDDQDVSKLCPRALRSNIAMVSQEPTLYQGSVRDNILMGADSASEAQVEEACKLANIHDFIISLPEGYSTPCGNRGTSLSGGQRQRIAIARALIRKPKLLLLDEATSALDTESEKIVQAALEKGREGCTTVAIAHRLSTIKDYDMICVFARGKIVESGTHKELLAKREIYYEMCLGQGLDST